ncbi:MAG: hypothetical protein B6I20_00650 [Bacteroidetes bacterium 4572_117]|nr:MAG: hypothetical protein B6I20_00650 [Bacteroidetes bacterium 4572_117]
MFFGQLYSQHSKKKLQITKIESVPKIDGKLDDKCWENVPVAKDFVQFTPYNGKPATEKTEVKVIYNNNAIFIGATLYDDYPDSIFTILTRRDAGYDAGADMFVVSIGTFNDGINSNSFVVTAAGVQSDVKGSSNNEATNWDAVWESAVKITDEGWVAEIKIPYSALRFSKDEEQTWGFNIYRGITRKQEVSSWNWINNGIDGFTNQTGELTGIKNIKPPLRLSFTPYFSTFVQHDSENDDWAKGIRGGMDLKYGINESLTLDMMLIPDFSQVQTDDAILNLSAFETQYEEKRPFFTEGTELFTKGEIFYSKRIGSYPKKFDDVEGQMAENEELISNPIETKIINATKITGRSKNGLGVGLFNAITLKSTAKINNTVTGVEREYITQAFTNYNILVFDQNLKNNSYISLINTNMLIPDSKYTANVTAGEFLLKNKKQNYHFNGIIGLSQIYDGQNNAEYGYKHELEFAKTGGHVRFELAQELIDNKFDPNDMGFLPYNNYVESQAEISYQILQPHWKLLEWLIRFDSEYQNQFNTANFMRWQIGMNMRSMFKNQWRWGFFFDMVPLGEHDYYEARKDGQVYKKAPEVYGGTFIGSDIRKKLSFGLFAMYWKSSSEYNENTFKFRLSPTWRVTNKLSFTVNINPAIQNNDIGYVNEISDVIYFGRRNRKTISNTFITNFTFNNKMSFSLRMRHYWSSAIYKQFFMLNTDGTLTQNSQYADNEDVSFNAFNIDMVYTWRFAPGSDMLVVWKNSIYDENELVIKDYFENLKNTFEAPQTNRFSIKVLYYLDYLYLKRKK